MPETALSNRAIDQETASLAHYSAMCREIAHCARVDEVKGIRDKAMALAVYAKQALNQEAERQAAEIRLRAEIRAGELLASMKEAGQRKGDGQRGKKSGNTELPLSQPRLTDLGISKKQSSDWQQVAAVPKREVEAYLADTSTIPTASGLLTRHKAAPAPIDATPKMNPSALWAWGTLCTFERDGVLKMNARQLFEGMTEPMQEDVSRLAPMVSGWISKFPTRKDKKK